MSGLMAMAAVAALVGESPPLREVVVTRPSGEDVAARRQALWELHFHVRRKTGHGIRLRAYTKR